MQSIQTTEGDVYLKSNDITSTNLGHQTENNLVDQASEIKDIYDHIYGNVQSKLEFYENKRGKIKNSISADVGECDKKTEKTVTTSNIPSYSLNIEHVENIDAKGNLPPTPDTPKTPVFIKPDYPINLDEIHHNTLKPVSQSNPDLLVDCKKECPKCEKLDFINDRSEVLAEINLNFKLEIDSIKNDFKREVAKNNELNFEIANIEAALELYCTEAKNQKSTLSSIYSSMKDTLKQTNDSKSSYTFKRIKIIADYIETLKSKLEHQDRIIKNNFIENPYHTDLIMRHDALRQQLDDLSRINEQLKNQIKHNSQEELDTIKELNRQKFQIENKCKEIESYYKNELSLKEIAMHNLEEKHKKELEDLNVTITQKEEEMLKAQKILEAKISNYKQELIAAYRRVKQMKKSTQLTQ